MTELAFTPRATEVFTVARDEALRLRHDRVGAEHIFLGLISVQNGAAVAAFDSAALDRQAARTRLEATFPLGSAPIDRGELPYAETGVGVITRAMTEARDMGSIYVSTGHVLLAALAPVDGLTRQIIADLGVDVDMVIDAVRADPNDR